MAAFLLFVICIIAVLVVWQTKDDWVSRIKPKGAEAKPTEEVVSNQEETPETIEDPKPFDPNA